MKVYLFPNINTVSKRSARTLPGGNSLGRHFTVGYSNGGIEALTMPEGSIAGGTVFFGFRDAGSSISSIVYLARLPGGEFTNAVGIDDVRFAAAIPEPSTG
jgi:hypothetical protein